MLFLALGRIAPVAIPPRGIDSPVARSRSAQSDPTDAARIVHLRGSSMLPTCTGLSKDEGSMQTLTDEIRTFIVHRLACFDTPTQVVEDVKTHFGIEISRQNVYAYDPKASQRVGPRWKELHAATRQAYLREVAEVGIAQKVVRLAMLDRMAHRAMADNYFIKTAAFLEQAAKECGGLYESRRSAVLPLPDPQLASPQLAAPQPSLPEPTVRQISLPPAAAGAERLADLKPMDQQPVDQHLQ
jgi:hypothetical protein